MKIKKTNILVLGADGFIGSNLIKSLLRDNEYAIRAFDLFKDGQSRNLENIKEDVEIFPGNFLNKDDLRTALKGIDYVFHFISLTTPGSSMNDPLMDVDTNVRGTIFLLDACVDAKVKRVIFSSSGGAIYGNNGTGYFKEEDATNPISPYAISKLTIEKYLEYYRINSGLDYLILRYANPYGPGQNVVGSQGIISIFLNLIRQEKPITIFGDGENIRDYIYIDDLVSITKLLFAKKNKYRIYNVGSGEGKSINEVIEVIKEVVGNDNLKINNQPSRSVDVERIVLNVRRIMGEACNISRTNLKDGIIETWKMLKQK
ncbi:MAG: UDP-glucose 4-epimerase [uncultured bacterium]|nr:MAG: UDP-glucose 4-epimerase [uncultured bacterium]